MKIIVATHKSYEFPQANYYEPICVGKALNNNELGILGDNTGDHISLKNESFCELTALYWAWKNNFFSDGEYAGLVHYRRYFSGKELTLKDKKIASRDELLAYLLVSDCIVPEKRNYYIESVYEHYKNAHFSKDLDLTRTIIVQYHPEYLPAFDKIMAGKTLHLFNMFVMKTEMLNAYCDWVFDILFKLEDEVDISNYDNYQRRIFGFIAERLFNVWLVKNNLKLTEVKVINIEGENLFLKAVNLLKRKFLKKR